MRAFFIGWLFVLCAYSFYQVQGCGGGSGGTKGYKGYATQFGKSFKLEFSCAHAIQSPGRSGQSLHRLKSVHDDGKEDRLWNYNCRNNPHITTSCAWVVPSGQYVNNYDKVVNFICPGKGYVVAMYGDHKHNYYNDRRFNFKCCTAKASRGQANCQWTSYLNDYDGRLNYAAPSWYYIAGAHSIHHDYYEDRRWQFYICR